MLPCLEHSRLGLGENTTLSLKSLNIFPRMFFNVKLILKVDLFSSIFGFWQFLWGLNFKVVKTVFR